jgi:hypothetical protein
MFRSHIGRIAIFLEAHSTPDTGLIHFKPGAATDLQPVSTFLHLLRTRPDLSSNTVHQLHFPRGSVLRHTRSTDNTFLVDLRWSIFQRSLCLCSTTIEHKVSKSSLTSVIADWGVGIIVMSSVKWLHFLHSTSNPILQASSAQDSLRRSTLNAKASHASYRICLLTMSGLGPIARSGSLFQEALTATSGSIGSHNPTASRPVINVSAVAYLGCCTLPSPRPLSSGAVVLASNPNPPNAAIL